MKLWTLIRAKKYGSPKKMILLALFQIAVIGIFLQIAWSYHSLETGLGAAMAQVVITYPVLLLMILVVAGIGLGHWIDQLIRLKRSIFHHPQKGSWTEAFESVGLRILS